MRNRASYEREEEAEKLRIIRNRRKEKRRSNGWSLRTVEKLKFSNTIVIRSFGVAGAALSTSRSGVKSWRMSIGRRKVQDTVGMKHKTGKRSKKRREPRPASLTRLAVSAATAPWLSILDRFDPHSSVSSRRIQSAPSARADVRLWFFL